MRFNEYYFKDGKFMMPLWLDLTTVNENGCFEMQIPHHILPKLVESGIIKLKKADKEFNNMDEAILFHDSSDYIISEEKEKDEVVWVDSKGNERSFEVVADNVKIGSDTIILNMSTAHNCMSAILGMCPISGKCYAMSKEKRFDKAREGDEKQAEQWSCMTPVAIAEGIRKIAAADSSIKYVRLNEAGEFRNLPQDLDMKGKLSDAQKAALADVDDIGKLKQIAGLVPQLTFYTYSHRKDLQGRLKNLGNNIVINGSGFMIDNAFMPIPFSQYIPIIDGIMSNRFKVVNGEEVTPKGVSECIGDCRVCDKCKVARGMQIYLPIHGSGSDKQKTIEKLKKSIIKNPQFDSILASNIGEDEKLDKLSDLMNVDDKDMLKRLKPIVAAKKGFFKSILNSEQAKIDFVMAMDAYVNSEIDNISAEEVAKDATELEKQKALASSIDSLMGRFKTNLSRAQAMGQDTGAKKWTRLMNSLEQIIDAAKEGKPYVTPKSLSAKL